jgi:hypothetical protein
MKLKNPSSEFISKILRKYYNNEGDLNKKLLLLFKTLNSNKNKYDVLIKVSALNQIYATSITNINPVVNRIVEVSNEFNISSKSTISNYKLFADKISDVKWKNNKGEYFKRNYLSFASKYVHFISDFKTPIYDSYIWIMIKGYIGQESGEKISFKSPKDLQEFYKTFELFRTHFGLEKYSYYELDKFLWQYGKILTQKIQSQNSLNIEKSKAELKKRIRVN